VQFCVNGALAVIVCKERKDGYMNNCISILGGDNRFKYVKAFFEKKGFAVNSVFYGGSDEKTEIAETVILPVPIMRNGFLNAPLTEKKVDEKSLFDILPENSVVFGGMSGEPLKEKCRRKGIRLFDYYKDEELLNKNAVLTAKATLILSKQEKIPIENGEIFILGYGRCGKALAKVFSDVGGHVTAVTGKSATDEYPFIHFSELKEKISASSLVINTVPSPVLGEEELKAVNKNTTLIEIASAPFGIDFECAKKLDINVIKAPSLPGRFFPEEAGRAIAECIFKEMNKCQK